MEGGCWDQVESEPPDRIRYVRDAMVILRIGAPLRQIEVVVSPHGLALSGRVG